MPLPGPRAPSALERGKDRARPRRWDEQTPRPHLGMVRKGPSGSTAWLSVARVPLGAWSRLSCWSGARPSLGCSETRLPAHGEGTFVVSSEHSNAPTCTNRGATAGCAQSTPRGVSCPCTPPPFERRSPCPPAGASSPRAAPAARWWRQRHPHFLIAAETTSALRSRCLGGPGAVGLWQGHWGLAFPGHGCSPRRRLRFQPGSGVCPAAGGKKPWPPGRSCLPLLPPFLLIENSPLCLSFCRTACAAVFSQCHWSQTRPWAARAVPRHCSSPVCPPFLGRDAALHGVRGTWPESSRTVHHSTLVSPGGRRSV